MKNEIDTYLERLNGRDKKLDWFQSIIAVVVILGIFYLITRPKVQVHTVTETEVEYIDRIVEIEVEKVTEIPIIHKDTIYQYLDSDEFDFDVVFKMYRKKLGPEKLFYWRSSLYTTNWKKENDKKYKN